MEANIVGHSSLLVSTAVNQLQHKVISFMYLDIVMLIAVMRKN